MILSTTPVTRLLSCAVISMFATSVFADNVIEFHSENVQFLRGWDYEPGERQRRIITAEHFNQWTYGDFFVFVDYIDPDDGDDTYYLEPTLRFSLGRITGATFESKLVEDVLIAINLEKAKGRDVSLLGGLAVDLNLAMFDYFKTHFYYRDDPDLDGGSHQITLVWKRAFALGRTRWVTEGFADFAGREGDGVPHQLVVPRILMEVSTLFGHKRLGLYAGIEYSFWRNKFGIDGITERVPQLQVMWVR